jgi:RNA polymerase sigma-70 factor (ECF subfamily)
MDKDHRYAALISENKDRIYRMCCSYVRDEETRKDVYQQVLIHIWQNLDSFEGKSLVSTWIYRITVNTCLSFLKSEHRRQKVFVPADSSQMEAHPDPAGEEREKETEEALEILFECLDELPLLDRTLMSLYLEDLNTREMAEVLDISEANVRVKVHRIKQGLKEAMERKSHGRR